MERTNSLGTGFMTVFVVSGSMAFLALQLHKRLLSNFMKRIDFELGHENCESKKRVRFGENTKEEASSTEIDNKGKLGAEDGNGMPLNRLALYKGILKYKMLFPKTGYGNGISRGRNSSCVHSIY
ncbi:unnamed protein product [Amaranthus hypochondriacus]